MSNQKDHKIIEGEWLISFCEEATYKEGFQGGRIELIPMWGDPTMDKVEIGSFVLPIDDWVRLRKRHEGIRFGGQKFTSPSPQEPSEK